MVGFRTFSCALTYAAVMADGRTFVLIRALGRGSISSTSDVGPHKPGGPMAAYV